MDTAALPLPEASPATVPEPASNAYAPTRPVAVVLLWPATGSDISARTSEGLSALS